MLQPAGDELRAFVVSSVFMVFAAAFVDLSRWAVLFDMMQSRRLLLFLQSTDICNLFERFLGEHFTGLDAGRVVVSSPHRWLFIVPTLNDRTFSHSHYECEFWVLSI